MKREIARLLPLTLVDVFSPQTAPETRLALLNAYRKHTEAIGELCAQTLDRDTAIAIGNAAALAIALQQFVTFAALACVDDTSTDLEVEGHLRASIDTLSERVLDSLATFREAARAAKKMQ